MPNQTVLITGCSSGIGRATALAFLDEEWTVYATSRDESDVEDLADLGCETDELDVRDGEQVRTVVRELLGREDRLDCVVNNAGYAQMGPVEDVPTDEVHRQFDVNVYGPHRLVREALPHMRERGDGTIVNVSSLVGRLSLPGAGVYASSKFALEAMSDALREEVQPFGVDVVLVEPGPVNTGFEDRVEEEMADLPRSEAYDRLYRLFDDVDAVSGVGAVEPEEVAEVILNAASATMPESRYTVGPMATAVSIGRLLPDRWRDAGYRLASKLVR